MQLRNHSSAPASGPQMPGKDAVRVLVADDHDVICAGLQRVIASQPDMAVCGMAKTGIEAVEKAMELRPEVAVLDMNMAGMNGLECTKEIRREVASCEVVLFTGLESDELMREAFASGARSFILKSDAQEHLLDAIRALAQHKPYFTSKVSEVIFSRLLRPGRHPAGEDADHEGRLTSRELELVRRLAMGESNREVAELLGVNLRTAEGHRAAIMKKMNFGSLADLVRYAVRNGIIEV